MEKLTGDKLIGLVDIYAEVDTKLGKSTHPIDRREIASYIFSTILIESNRILETVNNIIDKINESEYYIKKLQQVNKYTIIDDIVVKLKKDDMFVKAGNVVCYCNPDTKELIEIRLFFSIGKDSIEGTFELSTSNLFKNKEDCIEAIVKKAKENISKEYEKLIDKDYSYFLKNNNEMETHLRDKQDNYPENKLSTNQPEVFKGEEGPSLSGDGLEGEKGPSLSKEEWERISATIYSFANTELNLKRP